MGRNHFYDPSARSPSRANQNWFGDGKTVLHLRLIIYPDGGVARISLYGDIQLDLSSTGKNEIIDLYFMYYRTSIPIQANYFIDKAHCYEYQPISESINPSGKLSGQR